MAEDWPDKNVNKGALDPDATRIIPSTGGEKLLDGEKVPRLEGDFEINGDVDKEHSPGKHRKWISLFGSLAANIRTRLELVTGRTEKEEVKIDPEASLEIEATGEIEPGWTKRFSNMIHAPSRPNIGVSDLAARVQKGDIPLQAVLADSDSRSLQHKIDQAIYYLTRNYHVDPFHKGKHNPERKYSGPLHVYGKHGNSFNGIKLMSASAYKNACIALIKTVDSGSLDEITIERMNINIGDEICTLHYIPTQFISLDEDTIEEIGVATSPRGQKYLVRMRSQDPDFTSGMLPLPDSEQELRQYIDFFMEGAKTWKNTHCRDVQLAWSQIN